MDNLKRRLREAVKTFWGTRDSQQKKQHLAGRSDAGARSAVTGGKQMVGFEKIAYDLALECGIHPDCLFQSSNLELPGYFRPEKKWDLVIVENDVLIATLEFKSQVGPSFGNNFNNRTEEALGSATDLRTAYEKGAFGESPKPWLGYLFVLEDCAESTRPVKLRQPHFNSFPEFENASYAKRYELFISKLLSEGHYDGGCLILSKRGTGEFTEPNSLLTTEKFFTELKAHLSAYSKFKKGKK